MTLYHPATVSSCHCIIMPLYHHATVSSWHCINLPLYHHATVSSWHCIKMTLYNHATVSSCHCIILPLYHHATVSSCHCIIMPLYHPDTVSTCHCIIMPLYHPGQPDDGPHTGPKHVVVYYISLLTVILLCSWVYVYIDIYTLQLCVTDLTQRGWHTLKWNEFKEFFLSSKRPGIL